MNYKSTRNNNICVSGAKAIATGLSEDGGLFTPDSIPKITEEDIKRYGKMSYADIAFEVLKLYLPDFTDAELRNAVDKAYGDNFDAEDTAELSKLIPETYMLELWHGPSCAFKDMALQILPHLLTTSNKKINSDKESVILVATSGDTGKAALDGFCDVEGTRIMVFYPESGVSDMQKRQMMTQEGKNVNVCAVKGNFDDCQSGVKRIFTDKSVVEKLAENNMAFSSANSINCGRFLPQVVYYVYSYAKLLESGEITMGEKINFVVPTGNFGNILSAYYAKEMGVPINKLVCASNSNKVLTDFIKTGVYDKNREFITTISPSMDILISSNLERLIYILAGYDDKYVRECFDQLAKTGKYNVTPEIMERINADFYGGYCDDKQTQAAIKEVFDNYSYLMDTHTAVAYSIYQDYKKETGDQTKSVVVSTANPFKFVDAVYGAISDDTVGADEFETAQKLSRASGVDIPPSIKDLQSKEIRFDKTITEGEMIDAVLEFINR